MTSRDPARAERLKAALRANLRKRKEHDRLTGQKPASTDEGTAANPAGQPPEAGVVAGRETARFGKGKR